MKAVKAVISLSIMLGLVFLFNQRITTIPPLGKFLDPFGGFWQNAETGNTGGEINQVITELHDSVSVTFDSRGVPHIFAQNDHDLYLVQGYLTAKDRLWQMEFQTHAAAGRISEIIGEDAIEYDRFHRRLGMVYGARQAVKGMQSDSRSWAAVQAYTAGVNSYINSLNHRTLPLEYKILDYKPEPWTPLKIGLMLKNMTNTLTGDGSDLQMTNTLDKLGSELMEKFFPKHPPYTHPVISDIQWDFEPLQPQKPTSSFKPSVMENGFHMERDPGVGSNNWAVDGSKTLSGSPMLANDPHLNLTLPSIWYEIQLSSPTVNVYGVSLPGSPSVIIGFNEQIAWGVTNTGADVMDIYEIEFQDKNREHYFHGEQWKPTWVEIEEIKVRNSQTVLDTIVHTHHGPITLKEGESAFRDLTAPEHAIRWIAHEESNEMLTFLKINRAGNYEEFVDGIKHHYAPAQTYAYADTDGNIALWSNGLFPLRWDGQGDYISDGRDPLYDWQGWIPHDHNPHIKNPAEGYVSSNNQKQTDEDYPYYLGWLFATNERGIRLDEILEQGSDIDKDFMQEIQNDNHNLHARTILPFLLEKLDDQSLNTQQLEIISNLTAWDFEMMPESKAASVFHHWWDRLYNETWSKVYGIGIEHFIKYPLRDHTVYLMLNEPDSELFTFEDSGYHLTLDNLIHDSFVATVEDMTIKHGEFGGSWNWGRVQGTNIKHLADIPGFSTGHLLTGGADGVLNATRRGNNGPSWRMVVDLEEPVRGYGIYPGGQSGNPGSSHYQQFVDDWVEGELYELLFMKSADEDHESIAYRLNLNNDH
ncbi:MAG: penicillin acylase family protein [Balneolales bacterium]